MKCSVFDVHPVYTNILNNVKILFLDIAAYSVCSFSSKAVREFVNFLKLSVDLLNDALSKTVTVYNFYFI